MRAYPGRFVLFLLIASSAWPSLQAQNAKLRPLVDAYLNCDGAAAKECLEAILDLQPDVVDVEAALRRRPDSFETRSRPKVWLGKQRVELEIRVPIGHKAQSAPLPVALHLLLGRIPDRIDVPGVINVWMKGFNPPAHSHELRDGVLKAARWTAWRVNGDPERLWAIGFCWGAHAVFDLALHRPGTLRGIVPMAGCLRRQDFRLLTNLRTTTTFTFCGGKEDRELLWNLRELERRSAGLGIDVSLGIDDRVPGRLYPSPIYVPQAAALLEATPPRSRSLLLDFVADEAGVESDWLRIDAVRKREVKVPRRVAVPRGLNPDEQRRATIDATVEKTVALRADIEREGEALRLSFEAEGVTRATLMLRRSLLGSATTIQLRAVKGAKNPRSIRPDLKRMLRRARDDGHRLDPLIQAIPLRF